MEMTWKVSLLLLLCLIAVSADDDWTSQCYKCKCMWMSGKKSADCKDSNLSEIPKNLSPQLRDIDFSFNPIYELGTNVFLEAHLHDVHKLKLQNCSIESMHKTSLSGLALMIEIDLSRNSITQLDKDIFRDNLKLRQVILSHNKIKHLEQGLFVNMSYLQSVDLNYNEIHSINRGVFDHLPSLLHIGLAYNKLKHMEVDFTSNLPKLNSLSVEGNPWVCDCKLQAFRNRTVKLNFITSHTECAEPERLRGRMWADTSVIFACPPRIVEPLPSTQVLVDSTNFTISCKVLGEPKPDVDWVMGGRIVDRDPRQNSQKFLTVKNKDTLFTWNNLTITNINYRDKGEYKCVAKNPGGVDERNLTLLVNGDGSGGIIGNSATMGNILPVIIGLSIGGVIFLLIILLLVCCYCKKSVRDRPSKRHDLSQSSEYIGLDGRPEMEKALITDVNPIVKPPRQHSVPPSVQSGGTEVSDVKKTLLDEELIFGGDDESRSFNYEPHLPHRLQNHLEVDYHYPPDLLSFPPRGINGISPAGSSASTVADTSRLQPHHGPQSPLNSPIYDTANLYRTLPYSKSQSPFISPMGQPTRIPRQGGYVTIPRRPRQSWSSEPPPSSEIGEPLYDNLGLRTTAAGNSILSLNKIGEATTPKSPRNAIFQMNVTSPTQCDPIAENETQQHPITSTTLPRSTSAHRALSPTGGLWVRNPETTPIVRSSEQTNNRRDSTSSLPTPDAKTPKIPPRPPPKPKKRTSTGPLFEDEGEDGTEV